MGTTEQPSLPPPNGKKNTGLVGAGGTDGFGGYGRTFLSEAVGRGQANQPEDVLKASSFLTANKLLTKPTKHADESFFRAVEDSQHRLNDLAGGGLQIDGIAKPWGPTEVLSQRAVSSGKMKAPKEEVPEFFKPFADIRHNPSDLDGPAIDFLRTISGWINKSRKPFKNAKVTGGIKG
ncbi:MAG: hypothetical protein RIB80_07620 [Rhodospirillales bacterium]